MPKDEFFEYFSPVPLKYYTSGEATKLLAVSGNFGPWTEDEEDRAKSLWRH
jgi:hypothetical protein